MSNPQQLQTKGFSVDSQNQTSPEDAAKDQRLSALLDSAANERRMLKNKIIITLSFKY